jgi:hypothetical protein
MNIDRYHFIEKMKFLYFKKCRRKKKPENCNYLSKQSIYVKDVYESAITVTVLCREGSLITHIPYSERIQKYKVPHHKVKTFWKNVGC